MLWEVTTHLMHMVEHEKQGQLWYHIGYLKVNRVVLRYFFFVMLDDILDWVYKNHIMNLFEMT